jgi:hypothetical protein
MSNCYEKIDVGEGGSHGLEARATGARAFAASPTPPPLPPDPGAQASRL